MTSNSTTTTTTTVMMNESADYWFYGIGSNVIPANTKDKKTFENWTQWQDKPIPSELHEERKRNGDYNNGIAVMTGRLYKGQYKDKYLVAIDLDNKKAIEEFCKDGLDDLKQQTLIEQTSNPDKMHIYFIVEREIPNKASDKTNTEMLKKININEIPALEVKSNGKGIMFVADSPHKNGSNYKIIGTRKPQVFNAHDVEDRIRGICDKYSISYSFSSSNNNSSYQTPIEDLWKTETKILEGHNRHLELLRIMESLLQNNRKMPIEMIKQMAYFWNQNHCLPPLDNKECENQWKDALKFVSKRSFNDNTYSNNNNGNGNGHSNKYSNNSNTQQQNRIKLPTEKNYFEFVVKSIKKTVKCEDALIRQILYTGLSAYVEDDPINLGILAPTSEGKTYAIIESLQYFPDKDVVNIGKMSTMALVRQKGVLIDKTTGEPIEGKIQELRTKARELAKKRRVTKDKDEKSDIDYEIEQVGEDIRKIFENSKKLIDLRGTILLFLEPPQYELWNLLKPILSHDKKEIEYPFVDKTANSNAETKDVVVRGWPACIFCSAKDESKWDIWDEIKSRLLITSPNMIQQKYKESKKLITQRKGLPNLIQQQIIISDTEIETTKNCVLLIKQKINELKSKNKNNKIFTWIPYRELLDKELPENKGTDVRYTNKVFSLLDVICIVKSDLRMVLRMEGEDSIIANLQDLKEVLAITRNLGGLPPFKVEFYNDVFLPCYNVKIEPDSKKNDKGEKVKEEEIIAVTTRELCNNFKTVRNISITTDNLKKTYLNQLINEGIIDHADSKVDTRQDIYYPLDTNKISIISIMNPFDNLSQQNHPIYEKIIKNITEGWIFHEIIGLIRYRLGWGDIEENKIYDIKESDKLALVDYIKDTEKIHILDNTYILDGQGFRNNKILTIEEFIYKYSSIGKTGIDIFDTQLGNNWACLVKRSPNNIDSAHNRSNRYLQGGTFIT